MTQDNNELFLEATYTQAATLLDRHIERRNDWTVAEVREKHDYPRLLYEVDQRIKNGEPYDFPEGITYGLIITLLTENGIVYYPRDVGRIFNPSDKPPSENDPHETFTRIWTSEEFPHGEGLRDALELTGYDMVSLEKDRKTFQFSGEVPRPEDTAAGVAYTGTQELATNKPYRNIRKLLRDTIATSEDNLVKEVSSFMYDMIGHIGKDESLHASFINGTAEAAFATRDKKLVSFMLEGYASSLPKFAMPGRRSIPNFRRLQLRAAQNEIFTPYDLAEIKAKQYKKVLESAGHVALLEGGELAVQTISEDLNKIATKYPDLE